MESEEKKPEANISQDTVQNKYFWIIGAVIILILGWFGWNLIAGAEDYKISLVDGPKQTVAGGVVTFTWRIDGSPTTINHTAVYFGTVSSPGVLEKDVKQADTKYTGIVKDFDNGKYNIPLQFIGNAKVGAAGKYYYRLHATIKNKNYWSDEYTFEVKPAGDYQVSIINAPKEANIGQTVTITWRVDGAPTTINHTSIHFGEVSTPGNLGKAVKPSETKYTDLIKDFASGKYNIPLQFVGNIKIATPGALFYRGHALINGKNYWTDEGTFEVK